MPLSPPLENREGFLFIDGVSSLELTRLYGTPLYVYSEPTIRDRYARLRGALDGVHPRSRILYAMKANANLSVLRLLRGLGAEIDAVSPGEVHLALQAGFNPQQILFTGTSVAYDELLYLLERGVRLSVDSESQLERLLGVEVPETVSVRVNPELGAGHHEHVITAGAHAKFGVWDTYAVGVYEKAQRAGVERFGIQMHIGSGIHEAGHYIRAAERLLDVAAEIRRKLGIEFEFVDLGGGIGVPYKPGEKHLDLNAFLGEVLGYVKKRIREDKLGDPEIWVEPGRYLVAESGVLLTRVTTLKSNPERRYLGVDAGFNTLIRPAMYGSYHEILAASSLDAPPERYDVYGPLCESGDVFAREREIPKVGEGALLAVLNAGAYGFSMSSNYNARPRAAEVMVGGGRHRLVRERESLLDLARGQP